MFAESFAYTGNTESPSAAMAANGIVNFILVLLMHINSDKLIHY